MVLVKAIFLDRDGVINEYRPNDYVKSKQEFKIIASFESFIEKHKDRYKFIIITNQAGINKGIIDYKFFIENCEYIMNKFRIEAIYFCPHREEEKCKCRKPNNLLLLKAIERFSIDVENSYFIGDSYTDFLCANSVGMKFILTLTGKTKEKEVESWTKKPFRIIQNLSVLNL